MRVVIFTHLKLIIKIERQLQVGGNLNSKVQGSKRQCMLHSFYVDFVP